MLEINKKYRVRKFDECNLVIEKFKTVSSESKGTRDEWVWNGYYTSVEGALTSILSKELFESIEREKEIKDLLKVIEDSKKEIIEAVKKYKVKL